jgi:hypothetical protein
LPKATAAAAASSSLLCTRCAGVAIGCTRFAAWSSAQKRESANFAAIYWSPLFQAQCNNGGTRKIQKLKLVCFLIIAPPLPPHQYFCSEPLSTMCIAQSCDLVLGYCFFLWRAPSITGFVSVRDEWLGSQAQ